MLDPIFECWRAGKIIHAPHNVDHVPHDFHPAVDAAGALRKPTRFAPIRDSSGRPVPYLYGGETLDCAIFETVFHDVPIAAPDKYVDLADSAQRAYGHIVPLRDLKLVDLTTDGLHRLKFPKEELIASPASQYVATARWAEALHRQCADADGLLWMSRQRDRDHAVLLFGDRLAGALTGTRVGAALGSNDDLRRAIVTVALRAGIEVS